MRIITVVRNGELADGERFLEIAGACPVEAIGQSFLADTAIAADLVGTGLADRRLGRLRQIEKRLGVAIDLFDQRLGDAMPGDGVKADLAAGRVDGARDLLFAGGIAGEVE